MATRRRVRRKSISGNLTDIQKRIRYLETRPSASRLASKVVSTRNLALRAVEEDLVADNAIVRRSIAASAVGTAQIEQDSITNALIATNAVNSDSIAPEAVGTPELANDSVNNDKIATDAVNSDSILGGSVGNTELSGGIADSKISGMSSSKLIGDVEDSQISSISSSKISGVLDTDNIPDLATSKITSGVFDIDRVPEITADRMPNLDTSKFTTGEFDDLRIPNLAASKITASEFADARIPNLAASKITSDTFNIARIPTINTAKIENVAVTNAKLAENSGANAITSTKLANYSQGVIVNGGLVVSTGLTKTLVAGPAPIGGRLPSIINFDRGSSTGQVAAGNHVHGSGGYSSVGGTGVASHTHPVSIPSALPIVYTGGLHGGHARPPGNVAPAPNPNTGDHLHSQPTYGGTATSNTSTLKLKKDISNYEMYDVKNLLNLQLKRYKYKNEVRYLQESVNRDWMYGYIAEEVEDLGFKELVGYDEKGKPASLNYGLLSTLILELVKVQQTEIHLIKEKIKRQRRKYDKLSS
jgi:hypothetical protein